MGVPVMERGSIRARGIVGVLHVEYQGGGGASGLVSRGHNRGSFLMTDGFYGSFCRCSRKTS